MNPFVSFLRTLGSALAHIVGDPVHACAATALQTTLAASAQAIEAGAEQAFSKLSSKLDEVLSVSGAPGNVTQEAWKDLHQTAKEVHAEATAALSAPADVQTEEKATAPTAPTSPPTAAS